MNTSQKIIICLVIAFLCFLPSGTVVHNNVSLSAEEREAYAFAGLFAYMDPQVEQPKVPDVVVKDCQCKNGKVSYDGGGSLTDCPCKDGTCDCGCKNSKSKASGDAVGTSDEVQIKEKRVRMILVTDPPHCGPCRDVDRTLLATLQNEQHKKTGWTIGNKDTDSIQVLTLSNEEDMKIIEELELDYSSIPVFIRYGSEDEPLVGNVSYDTFIRYFYGGHKVPFYKSRTKIRWHINGSYSPSKQTVIKHLRSDKDHAAVANWPLEILSQADLIALHADVHNKDYGIIEWRDK